MSIIRATHQGLKWKLNMGDKDSRDLMAFMKVKVTIGTLGTPSDKGQSEDSVRSSEGYCDFNYLCLIGRW